jgi:hypothetical protein
MPVDRDPDGSIILNDPSEKGGLGQIAALVRFYFHTEPKSIEELCKLWGQLKFALQFDGKLKIIETKKG